MTCFRPSLMLHSALSEVHVQAHAHILKAEEAKEAKDGLVLISGGFSDWQQTL